MADLNVNLTIDKTTVGLDQVDNTSDANKPVSTAQATAIGVVQNDVDTHEARTDNPHSVTKAQIGLSNADNTADSDKPVSTPQATAIAAVQLDIDTHEARSDNPHSVTKTQVGLSNVDNTSDANKPVSSAQSTAIGVVQNDIDTHEARTDNPHSVTKTQVGLSNVDNTSDLSKPVSTAQQTALNLKADLTMMRYDYSSIRYSGGWYSLLHNGVLSSSTGFGSDAILAIPYIIAEGHSIDQIRAEITTFTAGGKIRLGVYSDNGSLYPGSLIDGSGDIDCSASNGFKSYSFSSAISLPASSKIVWLAMNLNSNSLGFRYTSSYLCLLQRSATLINNAYRVASTYGALPSTFPVGASAIGVNTYGGIILEVKKV